jgi:hypothetical protein
VLAVVIAVGVIAVAAVAAHFFLTRDRGMVYIVTISSPGTAAMSEVRFYDSTPDEVAKRRISRAIRRHCQSYGTTPDASGIICSIAAESVRAEPFDATDLLGSRGRLEMTRTLSWPALLVCVEDGWYTICQQDEDERFRIGCDDSLDGAMDWAVDHLLQKARRTVAAFNRVWDERSEDPQ